MNYQRLFSIIFSSFWLLAYYQDRLAKNRNDTGAFKLFLDSFWNGPRLWSITSIKHHAGHCYTVDLGRDFLSDKQGVSVLLMAEDGVALPLAHTRKTQDIVDHGGGRYFHAHCTLYFSPHDNADVATVLQRKYIVIERITDDQEVNTALGRLNDRRSLFSNPVLFALEKFKIFLGTKLFFGGLADLGASAIGIRKMSVDLSRWHLGKWQFDKLDVRTISSEKGTSVTTDFAEGKIDNQSDAIGGHSEVLFSHNGQILPRRFRLDIGAVNWLDTVADWSNEKLQSATVRFSNLRSFRENLMHAVGGDDNDYRRWLTQFVGDWRDGKLDISCVLAKDDADLILAAFDPASKQDGIVMSLRRDKDRLQLLASAPQPALKAIA